MPKETNSRPARAKDFFFKGIHINSVHQIQNLFHVIMGKDLTEFKGLGIDIYA